MAFRGTPTGSRKTLAQLALLLSSMLVPVHPLPVEQGTRFVIHVPHMIEHIHHHHKEEIYIPVVHHKKHPSEDNFKDWHHITVEENVGHHGDVTHSHEGFNSTPDKSQFEVSNGEFSSGKTQADSGFSITPEKTQSGLADSGFGVTPEKTHFGLADLEFTITSENTHGDVAESEFSITPEKNQGELEDSGFSTTSQKTEAAPSDGGFSLTPQKWPTLTALPQRNPFSGRHFGSSLGVQPPVKASYNPLSINVATQSTLGGDAKDEDAGYKTKEEVEDITTPSPPGFRPQVVTNVQTYQQSSGTAEMDAQQLLYQIKPIDYEPHLQLQYQAGLQPQINLEPQANVEEPVNPIGVSYIPGQVMSYHIMDHQGNAFNTLTLHNKREAKYKLNMPVLEPKNKIQRVRVPIRIQHSPLMAGLRLAHPADATYRLQQSGTPYFKTIVRVPEVMKSEKVSNFQGLKGGEKLPSAYDAVTSESKPVAQISTQDGKMLLKGKGRVPEKGLVRQREPGRLSSGVTLGIKAESPIHTKIVPNTVMKVRIPVPLSAVYKVPRKTPGDKAVLGPQPYTQINLQPGRLVPKAESKINSQKKAMPAQAGASTERKEAERTSNDESTASESNTKLDRSSQAGNMALKVENKHETAVTLHQKSPESKPTAAATPELQTTSKINSKMTDQQRGASSSPKGSSEEHSQFFPSIGPFGNSESMDIVLQRQQESASSKVKEKLSKKTSVTTQSA